AHDVETVAARGHAPDPRRGHAHVFAVGAVAAHAEVAAALHGDELAFPQPRAARIDHGADHLHPRHAGKARDHVAHARDRARVLVVDRGVARPDDDLARVEVGERLFDEPALALAAFGIQADGLELHGFTSFFCTTAPLASSASISSSGTPAACRISTECSPIAGGPRRTRACASRSPKAAPGMRTTPAWALRISTITPLCASWGEAASMS